MPGPQAEQIDEARPPIARSAGGIGTGKRWLTRHGWLLWLASERARAEGTRGHALRRGATGSMARQRVHGQAGLSFARLRVLDTLSDRAQRTRDLSNALNVAPRTITGLVDALEHHGLVVRSPHATDRRVTVLTITVEGKRQLITASKVRSEVISGLFGALSTHDRTQLDRILGALRDSLSDPPDAWKKAAPVRGMAP